MQEMLYIELMISYVVTDMFTTVTIGTLVFYVSGADLLYRPPHILFLLS